MRKFLLRWWYTPNWRAERQRFVRFEDTRAAMTDAEIQQHLCAALSRAIAEFRIYDDRVTKGMTDYDVRLPE